MCGIVGWVDWEHNLSAENTVLECITETLSHRGPDASGIWLSARAALGHRRLVVVDPVGGGQPMSRSHKGKNCTIVYNGELYNTDEIRTQLTSRGCNFVTRNSDTEVLLLAYMEWGIECLQHFNGIYAFAIWDETEEMLFMARDRLGVKPLFYSQQGQGLVFASELKALLAHPKVKTEVDEEGLAELLVMEPSRTPGHGIFRGVKELKPGCFLTFNRRATRVRRYWALHSLPHPDNIEDSADRVGYLLEKTVTRQLVSDVPLATFLSGGLDSSAITALAARFFAQEGREALHSFAVDYVDNEVNFRAGEFQPDPDFLWAGRVAEYLGTQHHSIILDNAELADSLLPSMRANDYPGMADIDASLYLFCREVKKETTVVLSGECADEIFGGYPWFFAGAKRQNDGFPWIRAVEERMALLSPEIVAQIRPQEYLMERYREALAEVPRLDGEEAEEARIRELFYLNITRFMPTLLDRKDRMSMAWGLEVRVPFADHELLEYVWNIPWKMKSCDNMAKGLLRRALSGLLPPDVLARRKSPYPKTHSPVYLKAVRDRVLDLLNDSSSTLFSLVNHDSIRSHLLTGSTVFSRPWFGQLMGEAQYLGYLIQLDTWFREYRVVI